MAHRVPRILLAVLLVIATAPVFSQQPDATYKYENRTPAYAAGQGPAVCIDEGHSNLHTLNGTYAPLATLLRDDGYQVRASTTFTVEALAQCHVLVIANAVAKANLGDRSLPHQSAFDKMEIETLASWVTNGGALLLVADHAPYPGAVRDFGLILGVEMLDAFAAASAQSGVLTVFGAADVSDATWEQYAKDRSLPARLFAEIRSNAGSLGAHPILRGRTEQERVPWVVTFTGHAFYGSDRVVPLLAFGPRAVAMPDRPDASSFPIGGWLQAGAVRMGKGRAVILGEATACTAQVGGPRRIPTGMNTPVAPYNARFCLNTLHWLTGLLDPVSGAEPSHTQMEPARPTVSANVSPGRAAHFHR